MMSKQILMLIGALFLVQCSNAAPYKDMDSAVLAVRERLVLTKLFANELSRFSEKILDNGKTIFEKVLKDPKVLDVKTEKMNSNLNDLRNFIEEYDKLDKTTNDSKKKYFAHLDRYNKVADKYQDEKVPLEDDEDKIVQQSLKENGLVKTVDFIKDDIQKFTEKIYNEVERYYNDLEEVQKDDESYYLKWMTAFKAEEDALKRADFIRKLVEGFDLENFSW